MNFDIGSLHFDELQSLEEFDSRLKYCFNCVNFFPRKFGLRLRNRAKGLAIHFASSSPLKLVLRKKRFCCDVQFSEMFWEERASINLRQDGTLQDLSSREQKNVEASSFFADMFRLSSVPLSVLKPGVPRQS